MPKQIDILKQYASLRSALEQEREAVQSRLQQIESVLGSGEPSTRTPTNGRSAKASAPPMRKQGRGRGQNATSLREEVLRATAQTSLSIREIVEAVQKAGYKFRTSNPVNSVGAYLYGAEGKKHFRKVDGKFGPLKGRASSAPVNNGTGTAGKRKRTMSPEARKKIAAAARARWAAIKAKKK